MPAFIDPLHPDHVADAPPRIHRDALMAPNRILPHWLLGSEAVALIHAFAGEIAISSVVVLTKRNVLAYMRHSDRLSNTYAMRLFNFACSRSSLLPRGNLAIGTLAWNRGVRRRDAKVPCWKMMVCHFRCRMCFGTLTGQSYEQFFVDETTVRVCARCTGVNQRGAPTCQHNHIRQQILGKRAHYMESRRVHERYRRCSRSDAWKRRILRARCRAHDRTFCADISTMSPIGPCDPVHRVPTFHRLGRMVDYCNGSLRADTTRLTRADGQSSHDAV